MKLQEAFDRCCCNSVTYSKGFTLAEVLVTLGIIGVISAMTLPTLMKNHQRQVYVTQLRTVVSQLSQAVEMAIQEHNAMTMAETPYKLSNNQAAQQFLSRYLKIVQTCNTQRTPCMASEYKLLDGNLFNDWAMEVSASSPCVSLANGAAVCMSDGFDTDEYRNGEYIWHDYVRLYIDVNGSQGPNVLGRDFFYAELYSDGKISDSYTNDFSWACEGNESTYGSGCLSKIIVDGWKMDY